MISLEKFISKATKHRGDAQVVLVVAVKGCSVEYYWNILLSVLERSKSIIVKKANVTEETGPIRDKLHAY